ncbi:MAG TPA: hypothetical protein PKY82_20545 [Pyrinomonadaceae bacterium]|nr:hypothetical protein [Pyrinomonadaceae bacterium]
MKTEDLTTILFDLASLLLVCPEPIKETYETDIEIVDPDWVSLIFRTKGLGIFKRALRLEVVEADHGIHSRIYISSIKIMKFLPVTEENLRKSFSWLETGVFDKKL